jgi:hypothetical protein
VRQFRVIAALQLGNDSPRQYLADFDSPLVERIDILCRSLGEHVVFVQSDELPSVLGVSFSPRITFAGLLPSHTRKRGLKIGRAFRLELRGAGALRKVRNPP